MNNIIEELLSSGRSPREVLNAISENLSETEQKEKDLAKLYPTKKLGFHTMKYVGERQVFVPDYNGYADYIRDEIHMIANDKFVYRYDGKKYKYVGKIELDKLCFDLTNREVKPENVGKFNKTTLANCFLEHDDFHPPEGFINLKNGILDLKTGELSPHSPKYYFKSCLNHNYDPAAECPEFMKFLDYVFEGDQELVKLTAECFGYTLMGGTPVSHKAFMLFGEGRNGKSTWLDTLVELIGYDNKSSVSMKNLDKPFSMVRLDGKLANIVEESPYKIDPEAFKNIVSGGSVSAAHKGKDEYDLRVKARLFFAANKFPSFQDASVGNRERLIIIPFKKFIKPEDRDTDIQNKLNKEMSGILNFALLGLEMLRERKFKFIQSKASKDIFEEYIEETDSVIRWFKEYIKFTGDKSDFCAVKNLYMAYKNDCAFDSVRPVGKTEFGRRLAKQICIKNTDAKVSKDNNRGYVTVRCKSTHYVIHRI